MRRISGYHSSPIADRDHADIEADQGEHTQHARVRARRLDRHRNLSLEGQPRRGHELHDVRLAVYPGIRNAQLRPIEVGQCFSRTRLERPERIVDRDLRDGDSVRTVVENADVDPVGRQRDLRDGKPFDRWDAAVLQEATRTHPDDERDEDAEQHERRKAQDPRRNGRLRDERRGRSGAEPQDSRPVSSALNRPIHPSSANSLWCAWNMNCPG